MKKSIGIVLGAIAFFAGAVYASAATIVDSTKDVSFSDTQHGTVRMVTPGSLLQGAGATAVTITSTEMSGDAWGDKVGWIKFKGTGTPEHVVTVTCSAGVATLGGFGFGQNTSWLNFGPFTDSTVEANDRPKIDASGNFSGSAWSPNYGWLVLDGLQATESPCGSSGGGGGSGGGTTGGGTTNPHPPTYIYDVDVTDPLQFTGDPKEPTVASCPYFNTYLRIGSVGSEVKKVQRFLNTKYGEKLRVDGVYGKKTSDAVHRFQQLYFDEIIRPWSPPLPLRTTGRWYKTTTGVANVLVGCPSGDVYLEDPKTTHSFESFFDRLFNNLFNR